MNSLTQIVLKDLYICDRIHSFLPRNDVLIRIKKNRENISSVKLSTYTSILVEDLGLEIAPDNTCNKNSKMLSIGYFGILEAQDYLEENFPELWLILEKEVVHDRFKLNEEFPIFQREYNMELDAHLVPIFHHNTKSPWCTYCIYFAKIHARIASRALFDQNILALTRNWGGIAGGNSEFVDLIIENIIPDHMKGQIIQDEILYNAGGSLHFFELSFAEWIQNLCIQITSYIQFIYKNEYDTIAAYTHESIIDSEISEDENVNSDDEQNEHEHVQENIDIGNNNNFE
jgi:hypothetical protein